MIATVNRVKTQPVDMGLINHNHLTSEETRNTSIEPGSAFELAAIWNDLEHVGTSDRKLDREKTREL
jgi:hypothetical protein